MCGEKVPNTVDLTPKLQKLPRPRNVVATRCCTNGGVEPEDNEEWVRHMHGEETPNTIDLHLKMQKNQSATHTSAAAIHRIDVNGQDRNKPVRPWTGRVCGEDDPTTVDLLPRCRETQN